MPFNIKLIDSMNFLRNRVETERTSFLVRGVVNLAAQNDALRVFVWDAPGGNARRQAIYPRYKSKRPPARTDIYKALHMLRDVLSHTSCWQWRLDGFEADDGIAALIPLFPHDPIEILSTDRDLLALTDGTRVKSIANPYDFHHAYIPLYKVTVGDHSDCIAGIPGYGDKGWAGADKMALASMVDKAIAGLPIADGLVAAANIKVGSKTHEWIKGEGRKVLADMRQIIEPFPVSADQMNTALTRGVDNPEAREAILQEFLL